MFESIKKIFFRNYFIPLCKDYQGPKIASHNCPFWAIVVVTICATTRHSATRMNFQFAIYRRYNLIKAITSNVHFHISPLVNNRVHTTQYCFHGIILKIWICNYVLHLLHSYDIEIVKRIDYLVHTRLKSFLYRNYKKNLWNRKKNNLLHYISW